MSPGRRRPGLGRQVLQDAIPSCPALGPCGTPTDQDKLPSQARRRPAAAQHTRLPSCIPDTLLRPLLPFRKGPSCSLPFPLQREERLVCANSPRPPSAISGIYVDCPQRSRVATLPTPAHPPLTVRLYPHPDRRTRRPRPPALPTSRPPARLRPHD
ncbi:uncharacterized protein B0I36DRAFT_119238 [Microdochium trichocladiopsis]|uniref:Uncharacterized protein n=1 Tax=Microdochium trichocladiopsis TaxID=1682393 RepID=A0A9P8Y7J5_9PEZI|nr:uncharacterized protein B0I36DRAFT_119238 [Microdochium trichocladiopsis]KAH7031163.1 hypothetical protein B0I36DRAFT_119238 [Microdochium trichocladiopsis]